MIKEERQKKILEKIKNNSKTNLLTLASELGVSYDSVRRDVIELEDKGLLKKVHGGVISNSFFDQFNNLDDFQTSAELKEIIHKALTLIKPNQTLILDGGSSNIYFARKIPKNIPLKIITNNLPLAICLNEHENINVITIGGTYFKRYNISIGSEVIQSLNNFNADIYFMGINGVHPEKGLTIRNYEESILKQKMMAVSSQTICFANEEKLNHIEAFKICNLGDISSLIASLNRKDKQLKDFNKTNII